jgi:23S rRNA (uracil-5-)-methyltransferase RumA
MKCAYFGKCGGCSLQHIDYSLQLENKKKALFSATKFPGIEVFSGAEYGYRNRMDFIFHPNGVGFRQKGNWGHIIDIDNCLISDDRLNELLSEVRNFFKNTDYFDIHKQSGTFRYAVIRTPRNDSSISFVLNQKSMRLADAIEKVKEFASKTTVNNILVTYVEPKNDSSVSSDFFAVKGKDMLSEEILGKRFEYSVQGFFQNNSIMAEKMQEYVNGLLKGYDTSDVCLLDLYAGVGTFGIINSSLFKHTVIIESFKECIDAAKKNILINNVANAEAILLDAKNLKKIELKKPLFVITDPPRSGMDLKTIQRLNELMPEVIVYISCNVEQLSKDIPKFKEYKIKSAALFDLFPQTNHSEAVVELVKK